VSQPAAAVIGTGFIGPVHVEALRRLGVPVRGVLGSTPERGRAAADALGLNAYDTLDDLLADPAVSVVHVTSPNRHHFEQCRRALGAGKHVVCEKPLGMNPAETAELCAVAARTPRVAAVNYNVRFYPHCLEARQRRLDGRLGPVYHVSGSYLQDWLFHDTDFNWRVLAEEGGELRAVADIGTHWLDLITFITGLEVEAVCADLRTCLPVRRRPHGPVETFTAGRPADAAEAVPVTTEDYGSVLLRFRGGAKGVFTVSQVTAGRKNCLRFDLAGAGESLSWDSQRPEELLIGHRDRPNELLLRDPALLSPEVRPFVNYPGGHAEGFPDTFKQLFRAVYAAVAAGRTAPTAEALYPTFADGHREAVACAAIARSQREQGWVSV
jgi:predicted dehydrogenase